ncbi:MAG: Crp/Fnr family transcriptional regulator [Roseburia sp.]|nr:Crp/Fnr family transcriptional regulator [Roseburia sp.]
MDYAFLEKTTLFQGCEAETIRSMLNCLGAETRTFEKGAVIYAAGTTVTRFGLVLSGSVQIINDDLWGNRSILDNIGAGRVFAETYAGLADEPLMVSVLAAENCEILFLNAAKITGSCPAACPHHAALIRNLLRISSQKNLNLSRRIFHTTPKSIRGRVLSYLSFQAASCGSPEFTIPFNRQQLADYLSVERSALSHELSKMQRDGLLTVHKNHFRLSEKL